jgi:hypothetical protein
MRRIPEMRADDALAMLEMPADLGRGNRRTVAGKNRVRRTTLSSSAKICCLSGSFPAPLRTRRPCPSWPARAVVRFDALQQRRIVAEQIEDRRSRGRQRGADIRRRLEYTDVMPAAANK